MSSNSINKKDYLKIHNKWYNIKNFKHPGGPVAMKLGRERDATALFEAHHALTSRDRLKALLLKYEVPAEEAIRLNLRTLDSKNKQVKEEVEVFDWGTGGIDRELTPFEKDLKEEVKGYFKKESERRGVSFMQATKATPQRWLEVLLFFFLAIASLPFFVAGYWCTLVITPVLFWIAAANATHDAMHFSLSTDWRVNWLFSFSAPFTSSPLMWYHQHVIGHHAYPNIARKDPDIAHAPALMRVHKSISWKNSHNYQMITTPIIWTLGATLYMTLVPLKAIVLGTFNRAVFLMSLTKWELTEHIVGRLLTAGLLWGWPWFVFPIWKAVVWAAVPMFIHSFCFMASTQLNHLTAVNAAASDSDYWKHQVVTSHSFAPFSRWTFLATGGLNLQIEHHLFPTVNHCHLPHLHYMVKTICARHNVVYHESENFWVALKKYVVHLQEMAVKPEKVLVAKKVQ